MHFSFLCTFSFITLVSFFAICTIFLTPVFCTAMPIFFHPPSLHYPLTSTPLAPEFPFPLSDLKLPIFPLPISNFTYTCSFQFPLFPFSSSNFQFFQCQYFPILHFVFQFSILVFQFSIFVFQFSIFVFQFSIFVFQFFILVFQFSIFAPNSPFLSSNSLPPHLFHSPFFSSLNVKSIFPFFSPSQAARNAFKGDETLEQLENDWSGLNLQNVFAQTLYTIQPLGVPQHYLDMVPNCEWKGVEGPDLIQLSQLKGFFPILVNVIKQGWFLLCKNVGMY